MAGAETATKASMATYSSASRESFRFLKRTQVSPQKPTDLGGDECWEEDFAIAKDGFERGFGGGLFESDARVDERVEQIGKKLPNECQAAKHQSEPHDDRIVA